MERPYLLRFGYMKKLPQTAEEFESHASYEVFYFHEGHGNYLIGDKVYPLIPGTLILMDGMTLHAPDRCEGKPYIRTTFNFDPAHIRSITDQRFAANPLEPFEQLGNFVIHLDKDERKEFEALLTRANQFYHPSETHSHDPLSDDMFKLTFIQCLFFIYGVLKKSDIKFGEKIERKSPHVQRIINYIEENYMNDIQLEQLGQELFVNHSYLSRTFREKTGMTIFNYLYKRRINQAKVYFQIEPQKSITDICFMVGFKNRSHFGKVFKRLEGITPEQFKLSLENATVTLDRYCMTQNDYTKRGKD